MTIARRNLIQGEGFRLIRKIEIKYLRSLYRANISNPGDLNLLFGRNDSGKSNFLRALNLFFNGRTGAEDYFDFFVEFSDIRREEAREVKGKQFISIRIDFNVPQNFRNSLGEAFSLKRQWNINGDMTETPPRSFGTGARIQLTKFINQIDYTHVPAIKDVSVFGDLIERMYDATAAKMALKSSLGDFVNTIQNETRPLSDRLRHALQIDTKIAAPNEMGRLFRTLDFEIGSEGHSLIVQKGDGVKARHIPELLRYINENEHGKNFFIWGFEEPENSLDLASAKAEAANFAEIASRNDTQIFISSHSPAFYLAEPAKGNSCSVRRFFVLKQEKVDDEVLPSEAIVEITSLEQAEEIMSEAGLSQLPFVVRTIEQYQSEVAERDREITRVKQSMYMGIPTIFLEGVSDKLIFERVLQLFFPELLDAVRFETKDSGGGDNYVCDSVAAWRMVHKHEVAKPRCAGIIDVDLKKDGVGSNKLDWNSVTGNVESGKIFCLKKPQRVVNLFSKGFRIPIVLETLYPATIWAYAARKSDFLVDVKDLSLRFPSDFLNKALNGEFPDLSELDAEMELMIRKEVNPFRKIKLAQYVIEGGDDVVSERLADARICLEPVLAYLGFIKS